MSELVGMRACPFCGMENTVRICSPADMGYDDDVVIQRAQTLGVLSYKQTQRIAVCDFTLGGCGASAGARDSKSEAIWAWNARATHDEGRSR